MTRLRAAAQMLDRMEGLTNNSGTALRSVNQSEVFDADDPYEDDPDALVLPDEDGNGLSSYDVNAHNIDTPLEDLLGDKKKKKKKLRFAHETRRPFRPKLNASTWNSLDPEDKKKWDMMSPDGKSKVLEYKKNLAIVRAEKEKARAGQAKNKDGSRKAFVTMLDEIEEEDDDDGFVDAQEEQPLSEDQLMGHFQALLCEQLGVDAAELKAYESQTEDIETSIPSKLPPSDIHRVLSSSDTKKKGPLTVLALT